jgi:hypothetical protein
MGLSVYGPIGPLDSQVGDGRTPSARSEIAIDAAAMGDPQCLSHAFWIPDRADDAVVADPDPQQVRIPGRGPSPTKSGSVDSLNVSLRSGCRPKVRQIRLTVDWLSPLAWAIERVDQCVASLGVDSNVLTITASTESR